MIRRARVIAVLGMLLAGAVGVISATQTWVDVVLADGSGQALAVPGAEAVAVLTPLSLAALALAGALSITGLVLRYVFGAIAIAIGGVLAALSAPVAFGPPVSAVTSTVTTATGIAGSDAIAALIATATPTPWPAVTLVAALMLAVVGAFTLVTARRWRSSADRKYRTGARAAAAQSRPHDAIDSWDDLSRGDDPTR
jgi:hypothetical protein